MNTLLFDFDDTLAEFSQAFYDKFGVRPEGTPKERYDEMAASLVRTDFYKNLPRIQAGIDLLQWSFQRRIGDPATLLLRAEAVSPLWVMKEKLNYTDKICAELGISRLDFSRIDYPEQFAEHAYRGVLISRNQKHLEIWNNSHLANKVPGIFLAETLEENIQLVTEALVKANQ